MADDLHIVSISELTAEIQRTLESGFPRVIVEGEIVGFKRHSASGHCYFALKDAGARLQCIIYRSDTGRIRFEPADGMLVHAVGRVSVYPPRGEYQMIVRGLRPAGEGELRRAYEELKLKLQAEGLFDPALKQPLPALPTTIGIITSRDGAALRDILNVLARRFPVARVVLKAVAVQGPGSAGEISAAIRAFNRAAEGSGPTVDVLIVGRGGGSEEDLWSFNEEIVARAIHASRIPVVSAVGHETDVSIADFVADLRAPTPSAAAELVVPDAAALITQLERLGGRLSRLVAHRVEIRRQRVLALVRSHAFNRPITRIGMMAQRRDELAGRLRSAVKHRAGRERLALEALASRLESLDPNGPLQRGFALIESAGHVVTRARKLEAGDRVDIRFIDGRRQAEVTPDSG